MVSVKDCPDCPDPDDRVGKSRPTNTYSMKTVKVFPHGDLFVTTCGRCGSIIYDQNKHTEWHNQQGV